MTGPSDVEGRAGKPERPYSARVRAAIAQQKEMAGEFREGPWPAKVRYVGGADIAFARGEEGLRAGKVGSWAVGVAVVWDLEEKRPVDAHLVRMPVEFPYVPGLLSFREEPILAAAIGKIGHPVDAWMFDGQGRAHPRGVGLATHMGIRLGVPTIGAAKSVLLGRYQMPEEVARLVKLPPKKRKAASRPVAAAPLLHKGKEVARAIWMMPRTEPVIVSQGHRCTLEQAVAAVIASTREGHWLPEPTRLADELTKRTRDLDEAAGRALLATVLRR